MTIVVRASWYEVNREWATEHGPTDLDNLCLLCPFCHRRFARRGRRVIMTRSLRHWIPPRWLEPQQQPRLDTAHHLPGIVFDPGGAITSIRQ